MKQCSSCGIKKDLDLFHKNKTSKDGYQHICKECKHKRYETDYKINKEKYLKKNADRRAQWKEYIDSYKKNCSCCPEKETVVLDFHHLRDKDFPIDTISKKYFNEENKELFKNEIAKCVVVCCNCHRKIHAGILNPPQQ